MSQHPDPYSDLPPPFSLPKSQAETEEIQRRRKRIAVETARRAPFFAGKLDHVDLERLDDPEEWRKIPILDKEMLRALSNEEFYRDFCIAPRREIAEYWRSGGATGRPLFYPRTHEDMRYNMPGFRRTYDCMGSGPEDIAFNSFPLGIHPAGHLWARAGEQMGLGMVWAGAGAALPSSIQLELIDTFEPNLWMGMNSYGLHLANMAEAADTDLAGGSVERVLCTAEPMSEAKRTKLQRAWGAEVFDCFGMTECTMMGGESPAHDGYHMYTDLAFIEVLDPDTLQPVAEGEVGTLVVTPLWGNHSTPFLRWSSGDLVTLRQEGRHDGPYAVFPVLKHAQRTIGFFKVRGINIGHSEFEDFMFGQAEVNDFKAEVVSGEGNDEFRLSVEFKRGSGAEVTQALAGRVKQTFELSLAVVVLETGTLGKEFEKNVKAPRFVDRRE